MAGHYPPEAAAEEIALWRAAHGGTLDPLLQAVRDCPVVSPQATMLNVLSVAVPEGAELLSGRLRDPELGPVTGPRDPPGFPGPCRRAGPARADPAAGRQETRYPAGPRWQTPPPLTRANRRTA